MQPSLAPLFGLVVVASILMRSESYQVTHEGQLVQADAYINADQQARLDALKPLIWTHIPKTGGSFQNTLYHHPGICPFMPPDALFKADGNMAVTLRAQEHPESLPEQGVELASRHLFVHLYVTEDNCPGGWNQDDDKMFLGHHGIGGMDLVSLAQHMVTFVRQPEQRMISAYNMGNWNSSGMTLAEYGRAQEGYMVRHLSTAIGHPWESAPQTKVEQVQYAKLVLANMAFVGITDQFDISICLFHAMFGGPCLDFEFENGRPGSMYSGLGTDLSNRTGASDPYDTTELNGFEDRYDGELFEYATELFNSRLELYSVNSATCPSACS